MFYNNKKQLTRQQKRAKERISEDLEPKKLANSPKQTREIL